MPASNILFRLLWVQEDERRARIVNPAEKKLWMQQGLNPWLQGKRPAHKPLNHEDTLKTSFLHLAELATSEFWLNLHHSRRPKQTFTKWACLIYEPGATKLLFFLQQWPKKALSLSLMDVRCDQQTNKKWCLQLLHQSQENHPTKFPKQFFRWYLLGDESIKIKHFLWVWGVFLWVWIMGSQNVMGSDYGSNINSEVVSTLLNAGLQGSGDVFVVSIGILDLTVDTREENLQRGNSIYHPKKKIVYDKVWI